MADIRERIEFLKKNPQMRGFSPEQLDRIIDREKEKARFEQTQGTKPQVATPAPLQTPPTFATLPGQTTQQEIEYFRRTNPVFADRQRFTDKQIRDILNEQKSQNFVSQPKPSATAAAATTAPKIIPPKIFTPDTKPRTVIATTATTAVPTTTTATTATVVDTATSQEEFYKKTIADLTKQLETAIGKVEAQPGTSVDVEKISRQSAYDFLYEQFSQYGLTSLVEDIRGLVESNVNPSEFTIRLRQTPAYKRRFAANDARIKAGLRALSEGEYIALEDQYQNILRNYGLPASYYAKDDIGRQEGFEKFIAGDVSPAEVEDRIQLGMNRVKNAAPEVEQTLRQFYPGITQSDILAYTLDPDKALTEIQRKIQAAEIGAEARRAGLTTGVTRAEELQRAGITKEAAQQGFQTIAEVLPRGSQLAEIYKQGPYTQQVAEQEVFALPGAAEAGRKRRKLSELEQASFTGQAGLTGGALGRERAGQF